MLTKTLIVRDKIAKHWDDRMTAASAVFASDDDFAAFYTSKYLIQDAGEAAWAHRVTGFSSDHMTAYIEFWGVMQALIIQQDAICELFKSICGTDPALADPSPWFELRELRNRCAGHPANKRIKGAKGGTLRSFMGRMFGDYDGITYEQYDSIAKASTSVTFDFGALLDAYDTQAAQLLTIALAEFKRKCP